MANQSTIDQVLGVFQFLSAATGADLGVPDQARLTAIADQIDSGQRNLLDVRNDLLQAIADSQGTSIEDVTGKVISGIFGDKAGVAASQTGETPEEMIARLTTGILGDQAAGNVDTGGTFADLRTSSTPPEPPPVPGTTEIGGVTLPSDVTKLVKVSPAVPGGLDEFYVQADVFGVTMSFFIGSQEDFDAMFPGGTSDFPSFDTMSRSEFVASPDFQFVSGTIDSIIGSEEPLAAQILRDMQAAGLEGLPQWLIDDKQALFAVIQANNEGWSAARLGEELSNTAGFQQRYPGFDNWYDPNRNGTIIDGIAEYAGLEDQIQKVLQAKRGPDTNVSVDYVGGLIAAGWGASEIGVLAEAEKQLFETPDALDNLNKLLEFNGQQPLGAQDFVSFMVEGTQFDQYEVINDALRGAALQAEGVSLSTGQLEALGTGVSLGVAGVGAFSQQARQTAVLLAQNLNDIQRGKLGVTKEHVLAAVFDDPSLLPAGETAASADVLLQKLGRERNALAQGTGGSTGFIDQSGRLRIQGLQSAG